MTQIATSQWIARHLRVSVSKANFHAVARSPSTAIKAIDCSFTLSGTQNIPFKFEAGIALFAKKKPRPFPPPYISPPSKSFSDPLSTYNKRYDKYGSTDSEVLRGITNGDDAVYVGRNFIAANDGVGAWSSRPGGHSGLVMHTFSISKRLLTLCSLWARLILHFWALEMENDLSKPDPIKYLQNAYEKTILATSEPNICKGTTTVAGAQLYHKVPCGYADGPARPLLYVTNLGDSQILVLRPRNSKLIFKTTQQWHWFNCPRQLGTNSPDTPRENANLDLVEIEEDDVVLAVSDGVTDNLWDHEIVENVVNSIKHWESQNRGQSNIENNDKAAEVMKYVAEELMKAAKAIAMNPYAESPFMEHAIEEGLAMEGGKPDDISVVAAICKKAS